MTLSIDHEQKDKNQERNVPKVNKPVKQRGRWRG